MSEVNPWRENGIIADFSKDHGAIRFFKPGMVVIGEFNEFIMVLMTDSISSISEDSTSMRWIVCFSFMALETITVLTEELQPCG